MARFLIEEIRINKAVLLGLTQPQLWSLLLVAVGFGLLLRTRGPAVERVSDCLCKGWRVPLKGKYDYVYD